MCVCVSECLNVHTHKHMCNVQLEYVMRVYVEKEMGHVL